MEGGTTFHFVTDGIEAALAQAKAAAGDLDVKIGGGRSLSTDSRAALVAKKRHHGTAVALARLDEPTGQ
jgi:dihydrofolate reductase